MNQNVRAWIKHFISLGGALNKKSQKARCVALFFVVLVVLSGCTSTTSGFKKASENDLKKFKEAIDSNNFSMCLDFDPYLERAPCCLYSDEIRFRLRNECIYRIAVTMKDASKCEYLQNVLGEFYKDSFIGVKAACVEKSSDPIKYKLEDLKL
jgi:hypothetical protein